MDKVRLDERGIGFSPDLEYFKTRQMVDWKPPILLKHLPNFLHRYSTGCPPVTHFVNVSCKVFPSARRLIEKVFTQQKCWCFVVWQC
jgi:hypothetical protein